MVLRHTQRFRWQIYTVKHHVFYPPCDELRNYNSKSLTLFNFLSLSHRLACFPPSLQPHQESPLHVSRTSRWEIYIRRCRIDVVLNASANCRICHKTARFLQFDVASTSKVGESPRFENQWDVDFHIKIRDIVLTSRGTSRKKPGLLQSTLHRL